MYDAFLNDKTGFKNSIIVYLLLSFVMFIGSFFILNNYYSVVESNDKNRVLYEEQAEWLKNYDADEVKRLDNLLIFPCKEAELDKVHKSQLQLFSQYGITVNSVDKRPVTEKNSSGLKAVKTSVNFNGSWDNVVALLNNFEKQISLVVITDLSLNYKSGVEGRMDYVVYYR